MNTNTKEINTMPDTIVVHRPSSATRPPVFDGADGVWIHHATSPSRLPSIAEHGLGGLRPLRGVYFSVWEEVAAVHGIVCARDMVDWTDEVAICSLLVPRALVRRGDDLLPVALRLRHAELQPYGGMITRTFNVADAARELGEARRRDIADHGRGAPSGDALNWTEFLEKFHTTNPANVGGN
jgi:hypothetical protein